jgi:hypothetical protein
MPATWGDPTCLQDRPGRINNIRSGPPDGGRSVEQAFAKLKSGLRKAGARTRDALWRTIGRLLDNFTPDECHNYLANSGYEFG